jgi:hypothetical protein
MVLNQDLCRRRREKGRYRGQLYPIKIGGGIEEIAIRDAHSRRGDREGKRKRQ